MFYFFSVPKCGISFFFYHILETFPSSFQIFTTSQFLFRGKTFKWVWWVERVNFTFWHWQSISVRCSLSWYRIPWVFTVGTWPWTMSWQLWRLSLTQVCEVSQFFPLGTANIELASHHPTQLFEEDSPEAHVRNMVLGHIPNSIASRIMRRRLCNLSWVAFSPLS